MRLRVWNKVDFLFAHRRLESDQPRAIERLNFNEAAIFVVEARCFRAEFIEHGIEKTGRWSHTPMAGEGNVDGFHCVQRVCSSTRQYIRDAWCSATPQDNRDPGCLCFRIESELFRRVM